MKKIRLMCAVVAILFATQFASAQAIRDGAVIPVSVNLNEVLRITITTGGNIEFTFNSIDDYQYGLGAGGVGPTAANGSNPTGTTGLTTAQPYYETDFMVSASRRWELQYGAEQATFLGTDKVTNTLTLDNVGFALTEVGTNVAGTDLLSVPTNDFTAADITALEIYPTVLITDGGVAGNANAGDGAANSFVMKWRCGTAETAGAAPTQMNATTILNQSPSPTPDHYVVNVIMELNSL